MVAKNYLIGIVILAILVVALGALYAMNNAKLASLSSEYETLKAKYANLQTNYTNLQTHYNSLQSLYNALKINYTNLKTKHNILETNYTNLQSTYLNLQAQYNSLQSQYNILKTNYTKLQDQYNKTYNEHQLLRSQYSTLQGQYDVLQARYQQLETNYTNLKTLFEITRNNYKQLINGLAPFDNITVQERIDSNELYLTHIFVPYGYNALVTLNMSSTKTAYVFMWGGGRWIAPVLWPVPSEITRPTTSTLILPPGVYRLWLLSEADNNNIGLTVRTVILRNLTNYLNVVERENTYAFTRTVTGRPETLPWSDIPIIVPYGYNITLSIKITSNRPIQSIYLIQVSYNGTTNYSQTLATNVQSYQAVRTLAPGYYYYIAILPTEGATVSVDIKPIAIKPIG
jgi:outer membrane murein-binding lipoprotein Lpp/archaellum component FlaC